MYRKTMEDLKKWKVSKDRKPLILQGARQVGKTWLLKEFGKTEYENYAYINLDNNPALESTFALDYDIERIVDSLEIASGTKIEKGKTLIILDEIQEIPRALSSLKYFYEDAPEYHIAVAGSLLGIALHPGTSYPVGKVDVINLCPMTFAEFLGAIGKTEYAKLIEQNQLTSTTVFNDNLNDLLKTYLIVGGMPGVVQNYLSEGNILNVRDIQNGILNAYDQDFSKHAPANVAPRIREILNVLPAELARENKKFIFKMIRSGARAKDYDAALLWLEDVGIAKKVPRVNSAKIPLSVYADHNIFKLFMLDVGLLGAKANLPIQSVLNGNSLFAEFKGALAEQFVFQELTAYGTELFYYATDDSKSEIDFILQTQNGDILPTEVKSGTNISSASLNAFLNKNPGIAGAVKLSLLPYKENEKIKNLPLYMAKTLSDIELGTDTIRIRNI